MFLFDLTPSCLLLFESRNVSLRLWDNFVQLFVARWIWPFEFWKQLLHWGAYWNPNESLFIPTHSLLQLPMKQQVAFWVFIIPICLFALSLWGFAGACLHLSPSSLPPPRRHSVNNWRNRFLPSGRREFWISPTVSCCVVFFCVSSC